MDKKVLSQSVGMLVRAGSLLGGWRWARRRGVAHEQREGVLWWEWGQCVQEALPFLLQHAFIPSEEGCMVG